MKRLILINGAMGIGKTAVSRELLKMLPKAAFLDGDWCWCMDPFVVNGETKEMVLKNICFVLNGFLSCPEFENIVFCWVMQEQEIIDSVLGGLNTQEAQIRIFTLTASADTLTERLKNDIAVGKREPDIIAKSLSYLKKYDSESTEKIPTDNISAKDTAKRILALI